MANCLSSRRAGRRRPLLAEQPGQKVELEFGGGEHALLDVFLDDPECRGGVFLEALVCGEELSRVGEVFRGDRSGLSCALDVVGEELAQFLPLLFLIQSGDFLEVLGWRMGEDAVPTENLEPVFGEPQEQSHCGGHVGRCP